MIKLIFYSQFTIGVQLAKNYQSKCRFLCALFNFYLLKLVVIGGAMETEVDTNKVEPFMIIDGKIKKIDYKVLKWGAYFVHKYCF